HEDDEQERRENAPLAETSGANTGLARLVQRLDGSDQLLIDTVPDQDLPHQNARNPIVSLLQVHEMNTGWAYSQIDHQVAAAWCPRCQSITFTYCHNTLTMFLVV